MEKGFYTHLDSVFGGALIDVCKRLGHNHVFINKEKKAVDCGGPDKCVVCKLEIDIKKAIDKSDGGSDDEEEGKEEK